jgi:hypothetical protein
VTALRKRCRALAALQRARVARLALSRLHRLLLDLMVSLLVICYMQGVLLWWHALSV